jgi:hypothetical protein
MSQSRGAGSRVPRVASAPDTLPAPLELCAYERKRDLPKLLPLWEWELAVVSAAEHARLLARLRRALRAERQRAVIGPTTSRATPSSCARTGPRLQRAQKVRGREPRARG